MNRLPWLLLVLPFVAGCDASQGDPAGPLFGLPIVSPGVESLSNDSLVVPIGEDRLSLIVNQRD